MAVDHADVGTASAGVTGISARIDRSFFYVFPALFVLYCAPGLAIAFAAVGAPWVSPDDVSKGFKVLTDLDLALIPALGGIILLPLSTYYSIAHRASDASRRKSVGIFYFFFLMFVIFGLLYLYVAYFSEAMKSYDLPDPADPSKLVVDATKTANGVAITYVKEFALYATTVLGVNTAFDSFVGRRH